MTLQLFTQKKTHRSNLKQNDVALNRKTRQVCQKQKLIVAVISNQLYSRHNRSMSISIWLLLGCEKFSFSPLYNEKSDVCWSKSSWFELRDTVQMQSTHMQRTDLNADISTWTHSSCNNEKPSLSLASSDMMWTWQAQKMHNYPQTVLWLKQHAFSYRLHLFPLNCRWVMSSSGM